MSPESSFTVNDFIIKTKKDINDKNKELNLKKKE